jgi:hypothetical protein
VINISGGSFGDGFKAEAASTINLRGISFFLEGVELTGLVPNEAFTVTDRNVTLTGVLADRSPVDFDLSSDPGNDGDFFDTNATVTVTPVPLQSTCPADFNNDGQVDGADFGAFGAAFGSSTGDANYDPAADFDDGGTIDGADFGIFGSEFSRTDC